MTVFILLLLPIVGWGQALDHLVPEDGPFGVHFSSYYAAVGSSLSRGTRGECLAQMVVLPSFTPEWMVRIDQGQIKTDPTLVEDPLTGQVTDTLWMYQADTVHYFATTGRADKSIWGLMWDNPKCSPEAIKTTVFTRPIRKDMAQAIVRAFRSQIQKARYTNNEEIGLDGVSFHFRAGNMFAKCWSPRPNTSPGRLVRLGMELADYSRAANDSVATSHLRKIKALARDLSK